MENNNETNEDVVKEKPATQLLTEVSQVVVEPSKKKSPLPLLLILVVLVFCGLAVWLFALGGNKIFDDKSKEPQKEEKQRDKQESKQEEKKEDKKQEEESQNKNEIEENQNESKEEENSDENKIEEPQNENKTVENPDDTKTNTNTADNDSLTRMVSNFLYYNTSYKTKIVISELSSQELLRYVFDVSNLKSKDTISENEIRAAVRRMFGNISFNNESIKCHACDDYEYIYSSANKSYVINNEHGAHGGPTRLLYDIRYESSEMDEDKNILTAYFKVIYYRVAQDLLYPEDDENFYPTIMDMKNKTNGLFPNSINWEPSIYGETLFKTAYEKYGDKIPYTKATFKIDGDNYYLQSIELP